MTCAPFCVSPRTQQSGDPGPTRLQKECCDPWPCLNRCRPFGKLAGECAPSQGRGDGVCVWLARSTSRQCRPGPDPESAPFLCMTPAQSRGGNEGAVTCVPSRCHTRLDRGSNPPCNNRPVRFVGSRTPNSHKATLQTSRSPIKSGMTPGVFGSRTQQTPSAIPDLIRDLHTSTHCAPAHRRGDGMRVWLARSTNRQCRPGPDPGSG